MIPPVLVLDLRNFHLDFVGEIPAFLDLADPRPAKEQLHENYAHGGGWRPQEGFTKTDRLTMRFPGDPPLKPLAAIPFREEIIVIYPHSYVAIIQPDDSFEICRMD
jgi:hypothetical protein